MLCLTLDVRIWRAHMMLLGRDVARKAGQANVLSPKLSYYNAS